MINLKKIKMNSHFYVLSSGCVLLFLIFVFLVIINSQPKLMCPLSIPTSFKEPAEANHRLQPEHVSSTHATTDFFSHQTSVANNYVTARASSLLLSSSSALPAAAENSSSETSVINQRLELLILSLLFVVIWFFGIFFSAATRKLVKEILYSIGKKKK